MKRDLVAGRAESLAQQRDPLGWQHGHDRFPRRQTVAHERRREPHELLVRRIDEGVVLEPGRRTVQGVGGAVLQHPNRVVRTARPRQSDGARRHTLFGAGGSTSSTRTPPADFGWMKFTREPAVPRFGSSYSRRAPRSREVAETASMSPTR